MPVCECMQIHTCVCVSVCVCACKCACLSLRECTSVLSLSLQDEACEIRVDGGMPEEKRESGGERENMNGER